MDLNGRILSRPPPAKIVMDMFCRERCGTVADPDGHTWMVGTYKTEPTAKEERKTALEHTVEQQATMGGFSGMSRLLNDDTLGSFRPDRLG